MDSLERQIEEARHRVVPAWDYQRANHVLKRVEERRAIQRGRRAISATALTAAAISSLIVWQLQSNERVEQWHQSQSPIIVAQAETTAADATAEVSPDPEKIPLVDGSSVQPRPGSAVRVIENEPGRIVLSLDAGRAKFDVIPNAARLFKIQVADVEVTVLGTVFDVARLNDEVKVIVSRGRVRVAGPAGETHIDAGGSRRFDYNGHPLDSELEFIPTARHAEEVPQDAEQAPLSRPGRRTRAWRSLAKAGDYEAAYAAMHAGTDGVALTYDPAALLDAADAARLSGHPEEGARYLARITKRHSDSPIAPLAAFTLGRVCLEELGQPHRAAKAFAMAYRLSPSGSLAQDALAREVEALSKGGREHDAYLRAQDYVRRYPQGRRLRAVRLYGNLD